MLSIRLPFDAESCNPPPQGPTTPPRLDVARLDCYSFSPFQPSAALPTEASPLPTPATTSLPLQVRLHSYIGSGKTYDVCSAQLTQMLHGGELHTADVVVKFCDPFVAGTPDRFDRDFGDMDELQEDADYVVESVEREAIIYTRLQSTAIVPRFFGLWDGVSSIIGHHRLLVMILENVGASLNPLISLSRAGNLIILQLYSTLHDRGVVHNALEVRHVRTRLPTFDESRVWDYDPASNVHPYSATKPAADRALPMPSLCLIDFVDASLEFDSDFDEQRMLELAKMKFIKEHGEAHAKLWIESGCGERPIKFPGALPTLDNYEEYYATFDPDFVDNSSDTE